jgi:hypothetical protein
MQPTITAVPSRGYYDGAASTCPPSVTAALIALGTSEATIETSIDEAGRADERSVGRWFAFRPSGGSTKAAEAPA